MQVKNVDRSHCNLSEKPLLHRRKKINKRKPVIIIGKFAFIRVNIHMKRR